MRYFRSSGQKCRFYSPGWARGICFKCNQTKESPANWLDVWLKLLYGFNGRRWPTVSKGVIEIVLSVAPLKISGVSMHFHSENGVQRAAYFRGGKKQ